MSDQRFEQDLRSVLRGMAPDDAPSALREAAAAVPRTHLAPTRGPLAGVRLFAALAGVAAMAILAVAGIAVLTRGGIGPIVGAPTASPSPWLTAAPSTSPSPLVAFEFAVVPTDGRAATSTEYSAVSDVMVARLTSLYGSGSASIVFGTGDQPSPVAIRTGGIPADDAEFAAVVLGTTGHVEFAVPGSQPLDVGAVVDTSKTPALFDEGWISTAAVTSSQNGVPAIRFTLKPGGARMLADWSKLHVGEYLAIVLDGRVIAAPQVKEAITGGEVDISVAGSQADAAATARSLAAILASGRLPIPVQQLSSAAMPTRAPTGHAMPDACLARVSLADFAGSQPLFIQQDVDHPASVVALFVGPVAVDPTMLWEMVCRTERQPDGSVVSASSVSGVNDRAVSGVAVVDHIRQPSDETIIDGRATTAVARIAITLTGGSEVEATVGTNAEGTFWLAWLHNGQQAVKATAYDAAGTAIWSQAIKP